jgi:hypothetical protein
VTGTSPHRRPRFSTRQFIQRGIYLTCLYLRPEPSFVHVRTPPGPKNTLISPHHRNYPSLRMMHRVNPISGSPNSRELPHLERMPMEDFAATLESHVSLLNRYRSSLVCHGDYRKSTAILKEVMYR